jgi:regulator of replication initiation timing
MKYTNTETSHMPVKKLRQLNRDVDSWKRTIAFMMEENIHLKNRLTEVLRDGFNRDLLEEMEDYQNCFIQQDESIGQLKNILSETDDLLTREIFEDGSIIHEIEYKIKKLRSEMNKAEDDFSRLKQRFSNYLAENI